MMDKRPDHRLRLSLNLQRPEESEIFDVIAHIENPAARREYLAALLVAGFRRIGPFDAWRSARYLRHAPSVTGPMIPAHEVSTGSLPDRVPSPVVEEKQDEKPGTAGPLESTGDTAKGSDTWYADLLK